MGQELQFHDPFKSLFQYDQCPIIIFKEPDDITLEYIYTAYTLNCFGLFRPALVYSIFF